MSRRRLDGALALLDEHLLELLDHGFDLPEVGIDLERALEIREGLLGLAEFAPAMRAVRCPCASFQSPNG